jgi:mono/diheme cytochrome c family protein
MRSRIGWTILGLAVVLIFVALMRFNLSALHEPGRVEVLVSDKARHFLVHRASRKAIPPRPAVTETDSNSSGAMLYGNDCSMCHGTDGHAQMPVGRWLYPRAADLTARQVQSYSDQELFWIIENGIRFTGMPAFGQVEAADHIWSLVDHVRKLPGN